MENAAKCVWRCPPICVYRYATWQLCVPVPRSNGVIIWTVRLRANSATVNSALTISVSANYLLANSGSQTLHNFGDAQRTARNRTSDSKSHQRREKRRSNRVSDLLTTDMRVMSPLMAVRRIAYEGHMDTTGHMDTATRSAERIWKMFIQRTLGWKWRRQSNKEIGNGKTSNNHSDRWQEQFNYMHMDNYHMHHYGHLDLDCNITLIYIYLLR